MINNEMPVGGLAAETLLASTQQKTIELDLVLQTVKQPLSEKMPDILVTNDDAAEISRLRAEVLRLETDSIAEQDIIDTMLNELTTVRDELADTQELLSRKESECADLRASASQQKLEYESLQKQVQEQAAAPVAPITPIRPAEPIMPTTRGHDADLRLLRQQVTNLMTDLSGKDAQLKAANTELVKERSEWKMLLLELNAATRARDQLALDYQSAVEVQKKMVMEKEETDNKAKAESAAHGAENVRELQDVMQLFKDNSERLAKEIRELENTNLALRDENAVRDKELYDERSANVALKMQAGVI